MVGTEIDFFGILFFQNLDEYVIFSGTILRAF
jgi:hypothetical protein